MYNGRVDRRALFTHGAVAMLGIAVGVAIGPFLSGVLALALLIVVSAVGVTMVYIVLDVFTMFLRRVVHTVPAIVKNRVSHDG